MKILCAGDCGVDDYTSLGIVRPGGISLNMAVHARKLFSSSDTVGVIGVIGNDKAAETVKKTCDDFEIQNYLEEKVGQTPVQYIKNTAEGEKIFTKYEAGVLHNYVVNKKQQQLLSHADLILSPLFTQIEPLFQSVLEVDTVGLKAADFGSLEDFNKEIAVVQKYIQKLHIAFFGLNSSDKNIIKQLKELTFKNNVLIVITLGSEGSIAFANGSESRAKPLRVATVVDTTGAGDAFTAAFLSNYMTTKNIQTSLNKGNTYAAEIVKQVGSF